MDVFNLDDLIEAYRTGVFPMADDRDDETLYLVDPPKRGILPIDGFHIPDRLKRTVRQSRYQVRVDTAFEAVIELCAQSADDRNATWISRPIQSLYQAMFARGLAHSVEVWDGPMLMGGLYGVAIDCAFFGESMVSRARDASKIALVHLVARLRAGGYQLLDCQFMTDHLRQFGTIEIDRAVYRRKLSLALGRRGDFYALAPQISGREALEVLSQL